MGRPLLAALVLALLAPGPAVPAQDEAARDLIRVRSAVAALRASARAQTDPGARLPPDLELHALRVDGESLVLTLDGAFGAAEDEVTEELRREALLGALSAAGVQRGVHLQVRGAGGRWRALGLDRPDPILPAAPPRPRVTPRLLRLPLGGALEGRRIALSAGHGWITDGAGGWRTQRALWRFQGCGDCRGILEDFLTAELVTNQVIPLLQGLGAEVILVREADHDLSTPALVDDGDAGFLETGAWSPGASEGGWAGDYRVAAPGEAAAAHFDPAVSGRRRVALRFREGDNRTQSALVTVEHTGGAETFEFDQRRMGRFWMDLGAFVLGPASRISVSPGTAEGFLVADAVKVGGGLWPGSGKPGWQMAAASYVPAAGAPAAVTGLGDVTIRPAYAEYVGPDLFVSIHANASGVVGGSSANGMSSYRYSCSTYGDHSPSDSATACDDPPGSRALLNTVHGAILARLRADWDPNFRDRGRLVANFGELRVLEGTPGVLIETGFFDNLADPSGSPPPRMSDNQALHDPRWREAFAYGLAEGLVRHLRPDDASLGAPPPRPEGLLAQNQADGTLRVSWRPVPGAELYQVWLAREGRAFGRGPVVSGTSGTLDDLEPRGAYVLRISAMSRSGEGLPSAAVTARFRGARNLAIAPAEVLVIQGYDRRDAWVQDVDNDLAYAVEHAEALAGITAAEPFWDGALDEAVEDGTVSLDPYRLVVLAAGKDSSEHLPVSPALQSALRAHRDGGGALFVSGEEVAFQLGSSGAAADAAFLEDMLGARYLADDSGAHLASGAGPFAALGELSIDDGSQGVYAVRYPDVLEPAAGAQAALTWPDGRAAAVAGPGLVYLGFPLETVIPAARRAALMEAALAQLVPGLGVGDLDGDGASDACEAAHGLDPRDAADGALDADGDGVSNADECAAGTDPTEGAGSDGGVAPPDGGPSPADGGASVADGGSTAQDGGRRLIRIQGGCGCSGAEGSFGPFALLALLGLRLRRRP